MIVDHNGAPNEYDNPGDLMGCPMDAVLAKWSHGWWNPWIAKKMMDITYHITI